MIATQKKILKYQFEDSKQLIYATILGNLLLGIILLFPDTGALLTSLRVQLCMITAVGIFIMRRSYDWKSSNINVIILLSYLGLVMIEYFSIGLPDYPMSYNFNKGQVSKGIMFDLLVWMLPTVYMVTRVLLIIPLVSVIKSSKKL